MLSPNYYSAVTPSGSMCQEYITLGTPSTAPTLLGVSGSVPMQPGKCDPSVWTKVLNSAQNSDGVYKFLERSAQVPVLPNNTNT